MKVQIPTAFRFLFKPKRYKVAYGGRGSGKSWAFAAALILLAASGTYRILCTREIQRSIEDSVYRLLIDTAERLGVDHQFDIGKAVIRHRVTGSEFLFTGLHRNRSKVKGYEGIDICWVEEAESVSKESWDYLIPTIRKDGSEVWVSFNPDQETDPVYEMFVGTDREDAHVTKVTWKDNPFFPAALQKEMEWDQEHDADKFRWVWQGFTRVISDALVFHGCFIEKPFSLEEIGQPDGGPYYGVDWGFSVDPTTCIRAFIKDQTLYIDHEAYGVHVDLDAMPALFDQVPGSREYTMTADSARPEMIHELNGRGFYINGARKGQGSVEDGIAHIRSYKQVVIHPRCRHTLEEFKLYSHKLDPLTGNPTPKLEDKHNHCIDALRYALEDVSRSVSVALI
jgi:phage terminase large subunit